MRGDFVEGVIFIKTALIPGDGAGCELRGIFCGCGHDSTVFDPEAQTRRELVEVPQLSYGGGVGDGCRAGCLGIFGNGLFGAQQRI
jgi:hypothetical protein